MSQAMEFSDACDQMVKIIYKGDQCTEAYGLMLMTFMDAKDDGETNRMALALAKDAIKETSGEVG